MALMNEFDQNGGATRGEYRTLLLLLDPFVPHMAEEIWERLAFGGQLSQAAWPTYDEAKCVESTVEIALQVNGKIRDRIRVAADIAAPDAIAAARANDKVAAAVAGMQTVKELYVPGKLVNIVVKPQ